MIPVVIVLALAAVVWLARRTVLVSRRGDQASDYLAANDLQVVGEGKHARWVLRTPEGAVYERPMGRGKWRQTVTGQEQAVHHLNEEVPA